MEPTGCSHRELDPATMRARVCGAADAVTCVGCLRGTCAEPFHVYARFCTLLPPGDLFAPGRKLYYWCGHCRAPLCTTCLGIADDYPCPPELVTSYDFRCLSCFSAVEVVTVEGTDYAGAAEALLSRAAAQ